MGLNKSFNNILFKVNSDNIKYNFPVYIFEIVFNLLQSEKCPIQEFVFLLLFLLYM